MAKSRTGWLLAGGYLAVVLAAAGYVAYRLALRPVNSELVGVYLILLSLPWSLLGGGVLGWAGIVGGIALNATILYQLGRLLERT